MVMVGVSSEDKKKERPIVAFAEISLHIEAKWFMESNIIRSKGPCLIFAWA